MKKYLEAKKRAAEDGKNNPLKAMMAQKEEMIPDEGYNLVGLDDFEEPGDQLFYVGHYDTHEEALEAQQEYAAEKGHIRTFIYGPNDA